MKTFRILPIAACFAVLLSQPAFAATLDGQQVSLGVYFPDIQSNDLRGYGTATVGSGIEFPNIGNPPFYTSSGNVVNADVDVSGNEISFTYKTAANLSSQGFNGYQFKLLSDTAPAITGVSVLSSSIGATDSDLSFTDGIVDLNVAGLTTTVGGTINLILALSDTQTVTPEPAVWGMIALAFGGFGLLGYVRKRRASN